MIRTKMKNFKKDSFQERYKIPNKAAAVFKVGVFIFSQPARQVPMSAVYYYACCS